MKPWSNPRVVNKTPIVTFVLLESANVQQLWRMWAQQTAAGQSLGGWIAVNIALLLWCNFYRVCCPEQKTAFWVTVVGVVMNAAVIATVVKFRFF